MSQPSNSTTSQPPDHPVIAISLDATDLVGALGVGVSVFAAYLLRRLRKVGAQLRELSKPSLLPPKEMARARELLAQLALISGADRVLLGLYHNGHLDSSGFHLSKLQVIAGYFSPGVSQVGEYLRTIPVSEVFELRHLWSSNTGIHSFDITDENLSTGCKTYMEVREIKCLRNITLMAGTQVEVGVIGLHYCRNACPCESTVNDPAFQAVIKELSKLATLRNTRPSALGELHLQR